MDLNSKPNTWMTHSGIVRKSKNSLGHDSALEKNQIWACRGLVEYEIVKPFDIIQTISEQLHKIGYPRAELQNVRCIYVHR